MDMEKLDNFFTQSSGPSDTEELDTAAGELNKKKDKRTDKQKQENKEKASRLRKHLSIPEEERQKKAEQRKKYRKHKDKQKHKDSRESALDANLLPEEKEEKETLQSKIRPKQEGFTEEDAKAAPKEAEKQEEGKDETKKPKLSEAIRKPEGVTDGGGESKPAVVTPAEGVPSEEEVTTRIEDKKSVKESINEAINDPKPGTMEALIADAESRRSEIPDGEARAIYEKSIQEISDREKAALELYKSSSNRTARAKIFEVLAKGVAQLATGFYGMKHGVDVSGADFSLIDWSDEFGRQKDLFDAEMDSLKRERTGVEGIEESRQERLQRLRDKIDAFKMKKIEMDAAKRAAKAAASSREKIAGMKARETKGKDDAFIKDAKKKAVDWETKGRPAFKGTISAFDKVEELLLHPDTRLGPETSIFGSTAVNTLAEGLGAIGFTGAKKSLKQGTDAYNTARSIIQLGMKDKLDSQFARREAELIIQNDFDPSLGKEIVLENMRRLRKVTENMAAAKEALFDHIKAGGTMENYKGLTSDDVFMNYVDNRKDNQGKEQTDTEAPKSKKMTPRDKQALRWAEKQTSDNPDDYKKALKIMERWSD